MNKRNNTRNLNPAFKTFFVAQNPIASAEFRDAIADDDADKASEAAWKRGQTLAVALGKRRVIRAHGTDKIVHDPFRDYRDHVADVQGVDAPDGLDRIGFENQVLNAKYTERDDFVDSVFTPAENADLDTAMKAIAPLSGDELSAMYEPKPETKIAA